VSNIRRISGKLQALRAVFGASAQKPKADLAADQTLMAVD
jgi:hypothetical protein